MEKYKYYCDKCQYGTNLKSSFEAHNKTILHITGKSGKKKDKKYLHVMIVISHQQMKIIF
jgi:hypothetical protein